MYQNDPMKVLTGEVRLSYAHLCKPIAGMSGGDEKYRVTLLIPKTDQATYADICQAIEAAAQEGMAKHWSNRRPADLGVPLYDGDGMQPSGKPWGDECKGHWVLRVTSNQKPQVVHVSNIHSELAPSDIYSGMYARVTVRFYAYKSAVKSGVSCGLGNVMKTRDGEPFGGQSDAADDFAGLEQAAAAPAYPGYPTQAAPAAALPYPAYPGYPAGPAVAPQPVYNPGPVGVPTINPLTGQPVQPAIDPVTGRPR